MNKDLMMYLQVRGKYHYLNRPLAVKQVASDFGLTPQGVSGMATRGSNRPDAHAYLMQYLADNAPSANDSTETINQVIMSGKSAIERHRTTLSNQTYYAIYRSDLHLPKFDFNAMRLYYRLLHLIQPVWISALNDALDNALLSQWFDRRKIKAQQFDDDLSLLYELHGLLATKERELAPDALQVAITGNHEIRLGQQDNKTLRDYITADAMLKLDAQGIVFNDTIARQNIFRVTDKLFWTHGYSHAKRGSTRGKANMEQVKYEQKLTHDFALVTGHVHKSDVSVTPYGTHYTAPCLCDLDPHYMRHKPKWNHGIVVSAFNPITHWHHTQVLQFEQRHDKLSTFFNGQQVSVSLE